MLSHTKACHSRSQLNDPGRPASHGKVSIATVSPLVPYAVPGLGSTIAFSNQTVGKFWAWLRTGADQYNQEDFSIILAGVRMNSIFSQAGVSADLKTRQLSCAKLDQQLGVRVVEMCEEDAVKAFPYDVEKYST